jgi:hypothetical protein
MLEELRLDNNQLTGAIPEFMQLPKLESFAVCPNNFVGFIPTFQYCHPDRTFSSSDFASCVDSDPNLIVVTVFDITDQRVTLNWTAVPDVTSYVIKGRIAGEEGWQFFDSATNSTVFDNLLPCTNYEYKVCGVFSNNGYTTFSEMGTCMTRGCPNETIIMTNVFIAQQIGNALQIQFNTDKEETATLQLYNSMGQMVEQTSNAVSIGENDITMPFRGQVTAGVYLLQIHTPTQHRTLRVSLF